MTVDRSRQGAPRRKGSCPAVLRSPAPTRSESGHRRQDPGSSLSPGKTRTKLAAAGRPPAPECSRCDRRMGWCAHWHPLRRPRTSSTQVTTARGKQRLLFPTICADEPVCRIEPSDFTNGLCAAFTDVCRHPCPSPSVSRSSASGQPRVTAAAGTPRARRVSWLRRESRGREPCMMRRLRCASTAESRPARKGNRRVQAEIFLSKHLVQRRLHDSKLRNRAHAI
jgi:hypothetical protein